MFPARGLWAIISAFGALLIITSCTPAPAGGGSGGGSMEPAPGDDNGMEDNGSDDSGMDDNGTDDTGNDDAAGDDDTDDMDAPSDLRGDFTPGTALNVGDATVSVMIPGDAASEEFTLEARLVSGVGLPAMPPGLTVTALELLPQGLEFAAPVTVRLALSEPAIATVLPVLFYDEERSAWVGNGNVAAVSQDGTEAEFTVDHFSLFGLPDPVPPPAEGDAIGSFVVISNDGMFQSDAISSDTAALLYSEFGDTFNISAMSQTINNQGMIKTKALGLDALSVFTAGNYLVAAIGGETSIFNDGQLNEPVVGVAIMSVSGGNVAVSVYVASPDRVITGTLAGTGA
jgi:hypothetical protein